MNKSWKICQITTRNSQKLLKVIYLQMIYCWKRKNCNEMKTDFNRLNPFGPLYESRTSILKNSSQC